MEPQHRRVDPDPSRRARGLTDELRHDVIELTREQRDRLNVILSEILDRGDEDEDEA